MIKKFTPNDFNQVAQIINKNWNYVKFGRSKENSRLFSMYDLLRSLYYSNYTSVYKKGADIVGFLFAHVEESDLQESYKYLLPRMEKLEDKLVDSEEGQIFYRYQGLYNRVNQKLIKDIDYEGEAEIILFAVNPNFKKKGIGSALLDHFYSFLKRQGINRCYLYTDTTSDYKFYLKKGFKCLNEITEKAELRNGEEIHFYLMESPKLIKNNYLSYYSE